MANTYHVLCINNPRTGSSFNIPWARTKTPSQSDYVAILKHVVCYWVLCSYFTPWRNFGPCACIVNITQEVVKIKAIIYYSGVIHSLYLRSLHSTLGNAKLSNPSPLYWQTMYLQKISKSQERMSFPASRLPWWPGIVSGSTEGVAVIAVLREEYAPYFWRVLN